MQVAFSTAALPAESWVPVIGVGVAVFALVGLEKAISARLPGRERELVEARVTG